MENTMNWHVGAKVTCRGLNWGECRVTFNNQDMIMLHCTQHDLVVCGSQEQLEQAGWSLISQNNIVRLDHWRRGRPPSSSPSDPSLE